MNYSNASVKVMRSHDYCHFEIQLGTSDLVDEEDVNALRVHAAELVDKAVEEYKGMKAALERRDSEAWMKAQIERELDRVKDVPMEEWSPRHKAMKKKLDDEAYWSRRRTWDYGDGPWEDEYPDESDDGIPFL